MAETTKDFIIAQAYKLFLNGSYDSVSINDLCKAIGLTKGALYHHFESKEAIFVSVIDTYLSIHPGRDVSDDWTLEQFIDFNIQYATDIMQTLIGKHPQYLPISYLSMIIDALRHYPGFAQKKLHLLLAEIEKIERMLTNAINRGEIRNDINVHIMAINFYSLSAGTFTTLLKENSPELALNLLREQMNELHKVLKI